MRVKATLIKTITDDGIVELDDSMKTDKQFIVELESICVKSWPKAEKMLGPSNRFSIFVYNGAECLEGTWFPLEMLKLEAE